MERIELATPEGPVEATVASPDGRGPWPGVVTGESWSGLKALASFLFHQDPIPHCPLRTHRAAARPQQQRA